MMFHNKPKKKKYKFEYSYRAYIGIGEDGKKHYKRFNGHSDVSMKFAEADAVAQANAFLGKVKAYGSNPCLTLYQAYREYIAVKENILSPVTIKGYISLMNHTFQNLMDEEIGDITQVEIQSAVNVLAATRSPKYVKNAHGLLSAVLTMYRPDFILHTTLPRTKVKQAFIPENDDIHRLLNTLRIHSPEMYKAVLLAAFGSLRRSEICALTVSDIKGDVVTVSKAMVPGVNSGYVTRDITKTDAGTREVTMPHEVILKLIPVGESDRIVNLNPHQITNYFGRELKNAGVTHFRFHDLRHYQASILHAMGVPDKYIMERCGWKTESVMRNVYQHTMNQKRKQVESEICSYFSDEFKDTI